MFYMSENEFRNKMRKQRLKNQSIARKQELLKEKNRYKNQRKKIQTSKIFFVLLFLSCTASQIFAMAIMWHFGDLSSLNTLLSCTLAEGVGIIGYYAKSFFESREEHRLEFEKEKFYTESANNETVYIDEDAVG